MNPTQRRGIVLIAVAAIGAVAVFVLLRGYVADVTHQVGPTVEGVALNADVTAFEPITPDMVRTTTLPERWAPRTMLTSPQALVGTVAGTDLRRGTLLQEGMTVAPSQIEQGQREVAILVDAETGVAGKIGPGALVDIYATFQAGEKSAAQAQILVQNARIVDVGVPRPEAPEDGQFAEGEVVPVTFAVSVDESLAITYAESFSQEVRLALRAPDDTTVLPSDRRVFRAKKPKSRRTNVTPTSETAPAVGQQ